MCSMPAWLADRGRPGCDQLKNRAIATALSAPCRARYSAQSATAQAPCLSFCLIHLRPASFTSDRPRHVRAGHGQWRPLVNAGQHCWKACWGQPLASSNLASSARLSCKNTQDGRRQVCLDVEICLSFVSVPDHETLCLRSQGQYADRTSAAVSPSHREPGPGLNGEVHARESCACRSRLAETFRIPAHA